MKKPNRNRPIRLRVLKIKKNYSLINNNPVSTPYR